MIRHVRPSPVPMGGAFAPKRGLILHVNRFSSGDKDSLAERGEFELPVPISELSDDSIRFTFATSRRNCKALSLQTTF